MKTTIDNYYNRPVIPLLLSFTAGIFIGDRVPGHIYLPFLTVAVSLLIIIRGICQGTSLIMAPLVLFATLGYLLIQNGLRCELSPANVFFYMDKEAYGISGTVETSPELKQFGQKFTLGNLNIGLNPDVSTVVSGKINVTAADDELPIKIGDRLYLFSRIKSFRNFNNPDAFDYKHFMAVQDIHGTAFGKKGEVHILESVEPSFMEKIRHSVEAFIEKTPVDVQTRAVLMALSTGRRSGISKELNNEFSITGTSHLLSISGLHVGIVSGVAFFILYRLLSYSQLILWQGRGRMYAGFLTLLPVVFYGLLAGLSPSTLRSVIMISLFMLTYCFEAEHDVINSLAFAALVILAVSPEMLFSVSFQLSFAAVFFIIWGMDNLGAGINSEEDNRSVVVRYLKSYILVSTFAFLEHCH